MPKKLYKITIKSQGFGKVKEVIIKRLTPKELEQFISSVGVNLPHPMLDEWVEDVQLLE